MKIQGPVRTGQPWTESPDPWARAQQRLPGLGRPHGKDRACSYLGARDAGPAPVGQHSVHHFSGTSWWAILGPGASSLGIWTSNCPPAERAQLSLLQEPPWIEMRAVKEEPTVEGEDQVRKMCVSSMNEHVQLSLPRTSWIREASHSTLESFFA